MSTIKILLVEDERIIALDIKSSLLKFGYAVPAIFSSGEKTLEKISDIQPDLVLMDIMLKGNIDGITTAAKIRDVYNIPVVYLTSHTDEETLERAKKTEPFGYIVKPFDEKDLYTTVEIALARAKAETEIRKSLEKEKEMNELKSRFVSMVSHEFRTPMATILFSSKLLENYSHKWTEEKKRIHLNRIQSAIQQMTNLLEDILTVGQAEAGKISFNPQPIDLYNFCLEIIEDIQITWADNKHQMNFIFPENFNECKAQMDEKLLRHIFTNLLSNAVKYSPEHGQINFIINYAENNQVIFQIQDYGIGIPAEDQKHLFETFHRATNVGNISGTGLGLAIVKRAVDLHGGHIAVESEMGVGTIFTISLPLHSQLNIF